MLLWALLCLLVSCNAYKPIIMMHGFAISMDAGTAHDWDNIRQWIQKYHPGTPTFALELFQALDSTRPLLEQLPVIVSTILEIQRNNSALFANGWIGMGHSQGGLLMRSVAESLNPPHNMQRLITLAGVLHGYYGLPFAIPFVGKELPLPVCTDILYSTLAQKEFSIAGFWKTPLDYNRYVQSTSFLPIMNNEIKTSASANFTRNFLSVHDVHCFGSPQDGDVVPWQTELWGYYADGTDQKVVPMNETRLYREDLFGLRTLDKRGSLHLHEVEGIQHAHWLSNETNFVQNVLPLLN